MSEIEDWTEIGFAWLFLIAAVLVVVMFVKGMPWASTVFIPRLMFANSAAVAACVVVFAPLSIFKKTRSWAGISYFFSSYLFGYVLFVFACVVAWQIWGFTGMILGMILGGVGVVPVAYAATIIHGYWTTVGDLIWGTFLTFGARGLGLFLIAKGAGATDEAQQSN